MGGKSTSTSDPKLAGISLQTSSLGLPMSIGWGRQRLKCNLIWYGAFNAIAHTTKTSGGKGLGGTSTNTTYSYTASIILALCDGPIVDVVTAYKDKSVYSGLNALQQAGLSLATGTPNQAPWSYMVSKFPSQALAYSGITYVYAQDYALNDGANLQNHSFEVDFPIQVQGLPDANPRDILVDFLTNTQHGLPGWGAGLIGDLSDWAKYCLAYNLLLSPLIEDQTTASDIVNEWMTATGSEVVWSEGVLKVGVYGDAPATANGVTWTPNLVPRYDLTEDDFYVASEGDPAVTLAIMDQSDAYNYVQVEWLDRSNQYNVAIMPAQDLDNITTYGPRRQDPTTIHSICDAQVAQTSAQLLLQRTLYQRETYTFKLPWNFAILEPMFDYLTLTTTSDSLQLNRRLVQIVQIDEDEDDSSILEVTAIGVDIGVASAAEYSSHSGDGYTPNQEVAPGEVSTPILINAPNSLTGTDPQVWIAASSTTPNWGGCEVWVSADDTEYTYVGKIDAPARMGYTTTELPSSPDPDTTNTVTMDVSSSLATLTTVTQTNADRGSNLSIIGDEVVTFQEATLNAAYNYTLSNFRRGLYGSSPADHPSGTHFAVLDDAVFRFGYGELNISGHIYIKLPSFNIFGRALEDISTLAAFDLDLEYSYPTTEWSLVTGAGKPQDNATVGAPAGTYVGGVLAETLVQQINDVVEQTNTDTTPPAVPTGLAISSTLVGNGTADVKFTWTSNSEGDLSGYRIGIGENGGGLVVFASPSNSYVLHGILPGTLMTAQLEAYDQSGNLSGYGPTVTYTVTGDTTAPGAPTNLSVAPGLDLVILLAQAPSDVDTVELKFYSSADTNIAHATVAGVVNARPSINAGLTLKQTDGSTMYYWASAIDSSGNEGATTGPVTGTTYTVSNADVTPGLVIPQNAITSLSAPGIQGQTSTYMGKLVRYDNGVWTAAVAAVDLTGVIASVQIAPGAIDITKIASGITAPLLVTKINMNDGTLVAPYGGALAYNTQDGILYSNKDGTKLATTWSPAFVPAASIQGQLTTDQITSIVASKVSGVLSTSSIPGLDASKLISGTLLPAVVPGLDASKITSGILSSSSIPGIDASKIVSGTFGDAFISGVSAAKLTTQITGTQITNGAITTPLLATGAVTANNIAANTITAAQIAAGTIVATNIAAGAITTSKLAVQSSSIFPDGNLADSNWWTVAPSLFDGTLGYTNPTSSWYMEPAGGSDAAGNISRVGSSGSWLLYDGNYRGTGVSGNIEQMVSPPVPGITAGKHYEFQCVLYNGAGSVGSSNRTLLWNCEWRSPSGIISSVTLGQATAGAGQVPIATQQVAPAGATAYRLYWYAQGTGAAFTGTLSFGSVVVREAAAGTLIVDGAITANKIAANTITATQIAANTIVAANIAAGTITATQIATGTLTATQIAAGTITGDRIAGNTITGSNIVAGTITASQIAANTITAGQIAAGAISATQIATGTITATQIAGGTITGDRIAANTITGSNIVASTITALQIAAGTITANQIAAGTITANQIAAGTITSAQISAGAITATQLGVTGASLFPDGQVQTAAWWTSNSITGSGYQNPAGSFYVDTNATPAVVQAKGSLNAWVSNASGTTAPNIQIIPPAIGGVIPGEYYEFKATMLNSSNRPNWSMTVQWFDGTGNYITAAGANCVNDAVSRQVSFQGQAPAGAAYMRLYWDANGSTAALTGQLYLGGITIRQANTGTMIVNGTIVASKIAAGTITATQIASGTLTGNLFNSASSLPSTLSIGNTGFQLGTVQAAAAAGQASGSNAVSYSELPAGTKGFSIAYNPGSFPVTTFQVGSTFGKNYLVWQASFTNTITADSAQQLSVITDRFPVADGAHMWAGGYFQANGLLVGVIHFWDGAGNNLGAQTLFSGGTGSYPSAAGQSWEGCLRGAFVDSPVSTATASIEIYLQSTQKGSNTGYLAGLMCCAASPGQTIPPSYSPGPNPDAAAVVNANTTVISPGKIQLTGGTTLTSWLYGGDNTLINGGAVAANTITANKLTIGNRNLNFPGVTFQVINGGNTIRIATGYVQYTDDGGNLQQITLLGQDITPGAGYWYVYWTKGGTGLGITGSPAINNDPNNVVLCTWQSGTLVLVANYGGTVIDGSQITTGSITATQIAARSITATNIAAGTLTGNEIAANTILAVNIQVGTITADRFLTNQGVDLASIVPGSLNFQTAGSGAQSGSSAPGAAIGPFAGTALETVNSHKLVGSITGSFHGSTSGTNPKTQDPYYSELNVYVAYNVNSAGWNYVYIGQSVSNGTTQVNFNLPFNFKSTWIGSTQFGIYATVQVSDGSGDQTAAVLTGTWTLTIEGDFFK